MNIQDIIIDKKILDRFWTKVAITANDEKCWNWTASTDGRGYGFFHIGTKTIRAHRVAYLISNKNLPQELDVCHTCDNGLCVNPKHLFLGTHQENMDDMAKKGRKIVKYGDENGSRKHPEKVKRGEDCHRSKLREEDVLEIRRLYSAGGTTQRKLAKQFGVTQCPIRLIINRKTWNHI